MADVNLEEELKRDPPPALETIAQGSKETPKDKTEGRLDQALGGVWDASKRETIQGILKNGMDEKALEALTALEADQGLVAGDAAGIAAEDVRAFHARNEDRKQKMEAAKTAAAAELNALLSDSDEGVPEKAAPAPMVEQPTKTAEQWKQEAEAVARNLEQIQAARAALEARKDTLNKAEEAYLTYTETYAKMADLQKRYAESEAVLVQKDEETVQAKAELNALEEKVAANAEEKKQVYAQKSSTEKRLEALNKQLEGALTPEARNRLAYDARRLQGDLAVQRSSIDGVEKEGQAIEAARSAQGEKIKGLETEFEAMLTAQEALQGERDAAVAEEATARNTYEGALAAVAAVAETFSEAPAEAAAEAAAETKVESKMKTERKNVSRASLALGAVAVPVATVAGSAVGALRGASWLANKTADLLDWASKKFGRPKWMSWVQEKMKPERKPDERGESGGDESGEANKKMTKESFEAWAKKYDMSGEWVEENLTLTDDGKIVALGDLDFSEMEDLKKIPKGISEIDGEVVLTKKQTRLASDARTKGYRVRFIEGEAAE